MKQSIGFNGVPILIPILVRLKSGPFLSRKISLIATDLTEVGWSICRPLYFEIVTNFAAILRV